MRTWTEIVNPRIVNKLIVKPVNNLSELNKRTNREAHAHRFSIAVLKDS